MKFRRQAAYIGVSRNRRARLSLKCARTTTNLVLLLSAIDFSGLPQEYRRLLSLAKERYGLEVVPLAPLSGGRTDATLFLVSATGQAFGGVEHFILKFDRANSRVRQGEIERHTLAERRAPAAFAAQHLPKLAYEIQHEGAAALFYTIAGQSLQRFSTLASCQDQNSLEAIFSATYDYLLNDWNTDATFDQSVHPSEILKRWLGYRLGSDGRIVSFLEDSLGIDKDTEGFLVEGDVFPNPLTYGVRASRWAETRPIDVLVGNQHGDLNIGNILASFERDSRLLEGYFLIDFALFKVDMPLLYDPCYLEMSYLIRELERVSLQKWVAFVSHFASVDVPDPRSVPVELAGTCTVLGAGRRSFERWVQQSHPSLSDDLWGQFWLAGVAAGLNFCNKAALSKEARLAGLIYSAAHLKRYCTQFGVPLPVDVRLLYDADKWEQGATMVDSGSRRADAQRHNLPVQLTQFIGRESELGAITALLQQPSVRLVTLTGPGGTGKTRLGLETARSLVDRFEGGVYFVDLAPVRDPEGVLVAIARAVELRESSGGSLIDELKGRLRQREILLALDNFEQVTEASARVAELLVECPGLKLVVTSREPLHVRGERVFPVPPLALPVTTKKNSAADLTRFEGIRLFIERAQAVKPGFELTDENSEAVCQICRRLDGLPLAIELATARISLFSPEALLERVGDRLKLLRGGARDLPARQQTLRDTIEWSYQLLETGEQQLFALLSQFNGCTLEDVEEVANGIELQQGLDLDILEGLASLVDKSLIRQSTARSGEPRFEMLETIREYAKERLDEDPDLSSAVQRAHATHFADLTRRQWERLTGSGRESALQEMEANLENMQAAWKYWTEAGDLVEVRKLSDGLWLLYDARGWYQMMADLAADLLDVLASSQSVPERSEQEIMLRISLARTLMTIRGCTPEVEEAYDRAMELCQQAGAVPQLFPVLRGLASFYLYIANLEKGATMGEQILTLAEAQNDSTMAMEGHLILGYSYAFLRDLREGLEHLDKAITLHDPDRRGSGRFRLGTDPGVASHTTTALILWMLGFPDRALNSARNAVELAGALDHPYSSAYSFFHSGLLRLWRREPTESLERARSVFEIADEHDFQIWRALALCLEGAAVAALGRPDDGLTKIERGVGLYQEMHTPPIFWPLLLVMQAEVYGEAGRPEHGIGLLEEAFEITGWTFVLSAETCRSRGTLLAGLGDENLAEAEGWFRQALDIATSRNAGMLELRAAIGLTHILEKRGEPDEGRRLLRPIFERFSEGFETADLVEAKALLAGDE